MTLLPRHAFGALAASALLFSALVAPATAQGDLRSERDEVQRKRAAVAAEIDTLKATDAEVEAALRTLAADVASQTAALRDAERKSAEADSALDAATTEVQTKKAEIADLDAKVKESAVAAYVNPPESGGLVDSLSSQNIGEAELKRGLLEAKSANQFDVFDQLERAREDLETARIAAEEAAVMAEQNRGAVATKLDDLTQAREQQQTVVAEIQSRLDHRLGEAQSLADLDEKLAAEITAEQQRIAAELAKQQAAAKRAAAATPPAAKQATGGGGGRASGGGGGGATIAITGSGSIVSVRGIRVHQSIANQLASMLSAAEADGISLSGGGYRDPAGQIAVRRNNCGTSNYAVYQMPASSCSPPTARPGQSMHERGLAVDFTYGGRIINSRSSPAFRWMANNAASYGFYNLPSEPWHWSVNGN